MLVKNLAPLRAYLKVWHADIPIYQKAMRSIVTGSGPKTQLTPSLRFEPLHFQRLKSSRVPRVLQEMWSRDHRHQISFLTLSRFERTSSSCEIIRTLYFSNDFRGIEINFLKVKKVCWKVRLSTKMFTTLNIFRQEPSS